MTNEVVASVTAASRMKKIYRLSSVYNRDVRAFESRVKVC